MICGGYCGFLDCEEGRGVPQTRGTSGEDDASPSASLHDFCALEAVASGLASASVMHFADLSSEGTATARCFIRCLNKPCNCSLALLSPAELLSA